MRGLDLNQRPLGYEGNSSREASQSDPKPNKDGDDLRDRRLGRLRAASVPLLHSSLIARRLELCAPCPAIGSALYHPGLLENLVRPDEHGLRDGEAQGLGGLEVDDQLESGGRVCHHVEREASRFISSRLMVQGNLLGFQPVVEGAHPVLFQIAGPQRIDEVTTL